jgi:hypothetical protein
VSSLSEGTIKRLTVARYLFHLALDHASRQRGVAAYVSHGSMGRIAKLSFHKSGICRSAFTSVHGAPYGMSDRVMQKWRRAPTPPAGTGGASCVFRLHFPTDYLSTALEKPRKSVTWLPAPQGATQVVEIAVYKRGRSDSPFFDHHT